MKNRTTAALLAFFLGGIGVHRFYLNQGGKGIVYLLFFWTFIPAIIGFVDSIIFISQSDDVFNEKYNKGISPQYVKGNINVADELQKLYELKEKGIITDIEFDNRKRLLMQ